jgi:GDP-L-fucose synthase
VIDEPFDDPFPLSEAMLRRLSFFKGLRVVVTGATGLIGSHVVSLLQDVDADVIMACRLSSSLRSHQPLPEYDTADLLRYNDAFELLHRVEPVDVVLSCAGITGGVGLTQTDPISYVTLATTIALNTLHAAQAAGVALFGFLSSTTVYAPGVYPVDETYPGFAVRPADMPPNYTEPYSLYAGIGYAKRFLEQTCAYVSDRTKTKCAIVRPSGAYGRYDNFDEATSHVIPGMIRRALRLYSDEPFVIWGDGQDVRDVVHAQDVALGLLLATAATGQGHVPPAEPFNIASGRAVTTREFAAAVLTACGHPDVGVICDPSKPTALKTRRVSIVKAQRALGYDPQIELDAGLRDVVSFLKGIEASKVSP